MPQMQRDHWKWIWWIVEMMRKRLGLERSDVVLVYLSIFYTSYISAHTFDMFSQHKCLFFMKIMLLHLIPWRTAVNSVFSHKFTVFPLSDCFQATFFLNLCIFLFRCLKPQMVSCRLPVVICCSHSGSVMLVHLLWCLFVQ